MAEPALKRAFRLEDGFRNSLERGVGQQLTAAGIPFDYEKEWVHYAVPARPAKYLVDFRLRNTRIVIETKGWFGRSGAKERQKYVLLKEQHPEIDLRFVFSDANKKIYTGSKTTYAQWAEDHNFLWSTKGVIPKEWLREIREEQRLGSGPASKSMRKAAGPGAVTKMKTATATTATRERRT